MQDQFKIFGNTTEEFRMKKLSVLVILFILIAASVPAQEPISNLVITPSNQKGNISINYDLAPAGKYGTWTVKVYYSIESKSDFLEITDECSGSVGPNVKPGKYRGIVWNVLDHRQGLTANPCYIKLEAVYEAIGYAKYVDMGEEEEYPEYGSGDYDIDPGTGADYDRGGPEVSTADGATFTAFAVRRQPGTYRLRFSSRLTNNGDRKYFDGGAIDVTLVTSEGEIMSRSGVLRRSDTNDYVNMWLNPGQYQIMHADIDFGNIDVEEVLFADISFSNGLNFHIRSFEEYF